MNSLRVNYILPRSRANGPGLRYTIWVQGCSIHCPGCSNVDTWDPSGGSDMPIESLIENINSDPELDGITITGGEPLDQFEPVSGLCSRLFGRTNIFLTTGYTVTDILLKGLAGIFKLTDILCAGPFEEDKICSGEWKGSSNQVILYLTESGEKQSLLPVVKKEYHIDSSGIIKTGFTR